MVDPHRCIGCKYCIASCPYDVRYLHPLKRIVQKCQRCHHRVDVGLEPACVNACPTRALIFGDLGDPSSEVSRLIATLPVTVLKPEKDTGPQVYYVGADMLAQRAAGSPEGERNHNRPSLGDALRARVAGAQFFSWGNTWRGWGAEGLYRWGKEECPPGGG